jgi:hypothetical protein
MLHDEGYAASFEEVFPTINGMLQDAFITSNLRSFKVTPTMQVRLLAVRTTDSGKSLLIFDDAILMRSLSIVVELCFAVCAYQARAVRGE